MGGSVGVSVGVVVGVVVGVRVGVTVIVEVGVEVAVAGEHDVMNNVPNMHKKTNKRLKHKRLAPIRSFHYTDGA